MASTTRCFEYTFQDPTFEAVLVAPQGAGPLPTVLVAHAWSGRSAYAERRATELAARGYAAVAIDVDGKGVRGANDPEVGLAHDARAEQRAMTSLYAFLEELFR